MVTFVLSTFPDEAFVCRTSGPNWCARYEKRIQAGHITEPKANQDEMRRRINIHDPEKQQSHTHPGEAIWPVPAKQRCPGRVHADMVHARLPQIHPRLLPRTLNA